MATKLGIVFCFLIYMIFWIQIPGMLFGSILLPRRLKWSTKLSAGFFLGFTVMAIIYYIESLVGGDYFLHIAGPVLSVAAIIYYFKNKRPPLLQEGERIRPTFYIILAIIFIMCLLGYFFPFVNATEGITTQVFHDMLFHVGNITSLSRSFPNDDIRVVGVTFYYHYFMELLFAMCKHMFGMNSYDLYIWGDAPMSAWVLAPALITIGETIKGDRKVSEFNYFVYSFSAFLSCVGVMHLTVRWRWFPASWLNNHMFCNGNAIGIATASTIIVLDILVAIWNSKVNIKYITALVLLMIAATGFKGTTGLQLAGIIFAVFIIEWIITKQFSKQKLFYALSALISFAVTYITVVAGWNTNGSNNRTTTFGVDGTLELSAASNYFIERGLISKTSICGVAFMLILNIICITGPLIVLVVAFSVGKFKELFKTWEIGNIYDWFCIGSIIIAWFGYCFFGIEGMSQAYLVLSVSPIIMYCVFRYVDSREGKVARYYTNLVMVVGLMLLFVDCGFYVHDIQKQNEIYKSSDKGADDLVNHYVMEGYFWLRDNTPEDSLVAVDMHTEGLDFRYIYFYCSSFSERQCYIEGYDYTDVNEKISDKMMAISDTFYYDNKDVVEKALKKRKIDYLVVTEKAHPGYVPPTDRLELCFENSKIKIYKFE